MNLRLIRQKKKNVGASLIGVAIIAQSEFAQMIFVKMVSKILKLGDCKWKSPTELKCDCHDGFDGDKCDNQWCLENSCHGHGILTNN